MKQHHIDEKTGISYTLQGDYYLPDLALLNEKQAEIGVWGGGIWNISNNTTRCDILIC